MLPGKIKIKATGKKLTALVLILSFIALPTNLISREKQGAQVIIHKTSGQIQKGELIAVVQSSLLIKESLSGADASINIDEIKMITMTKKPKLLMGAIIGTLAGGASGILVGVLLSFFKKGEEDFSWEYGRTGGKIGLAAGAVGGGILGSKAGQDITIKIEGKPQETKERYLEILRSEARIQNYQK